MNFAMITGKNPQPWGGFLYRQGSSSSYTHMVIVGSRSQNKWLWKPYLSHAEPHTEREVSQQETLE